MIAVVEIAKEHRTRLAVEIGKLDVFIRMAEALIADSRGADCVPAADPDSPESTSLLADNNCDAFSFVADGAA